MKNNDTVMTKEQLWANVQELAEGNDTKGFCEALNQYFETTAQSIFAEYNDTANTAHDAAVLNTRGVRQLTTEERGYYQKVTEAMRSGNPQQALTNINVVLPETVIDSVFEDLKEKHPLLDKINFVPSGALVKMLVNTNGRQEAVWGALTDKIVKELLSGFKEIDVTLAKASAFIPISKAMLDLGPEWLDRYIREILYDALANGLERAILTGDGKNCPIGMIREVGDDVAVMGGAYPEKAKIKVNDLYPETVGNLLSMLAVDANGKTRTVSNVILVVNEQDYLQKIFPATTVMANGQYVNNVMPYPMDIIRSAVMPKGTAVLGLADKYFAAAGMGKNGRIEYSDHYQFLEDNRVYLIKLPAYGMPKDNAAFLHLDIADLRPSHQRVETVTAPTPSAAAELSALKISGVKLSPTFAGETTSYTGTTKAATNTITATPADAGAEVAITVGDAAVENGAAATWKGGSNTVTVTVTAADGKTTKEYTATVTKS